MELAQSKLYGSEEPVWLPRVVQDHDSHPSGAAGDEAAAETARARALDGLGVLAWRQGDYAYAAEVLSHALDLMRRRDDTWGLSRALVHLGILHTDRGNYAGAQTVYEESLALSRRLGDKQRTATVLHNLGNLATYQNDFERAAPLYEECLALYRELADRGGIALINFGLGNIARVRHDYARARETFEESLSLARDMGDDWTAANAVHNLSLVAVAQGDDASSDALTRESFELLGRLGDAQTLANAQAELGLSYLERGDLARAAGFFNDSLGRQHSLANQLGMAEVLEHLAAIAHRSGAPEVAVRLLGAAAGLREAAQAPVPAHRQAAYTALITALQEKLGEPDFQNQKAAGQALSLEQAIREARSVIPDGEPAAEAGPPGSR
jgi:tetratricopeptide (TPR) repeat protein